MFEGRELTLAISEYINKNRYSNSGKTVIEPSIDVDFFNRALPIILTPTMSHLNLAQAFAKERRITAKQI
jgi:hypothetical protein